MRKNQKSPAYQGTESQTNTIAGQSIGETKLNANKYEKRRRHNQTAPQIDDATIRSHQKLNNMITRRRHNQMAPQAMQQPRHQTGKHTHHQHTHSTR